MATNKEQRITITSNSGISDDEIERMVKDAEKFAAEDEKKAKEIEIRNQADSLVYQADKTVEDMGDKLAAEDKDKIIAAKDELAEAMKSNNLDDIEAKTKELTNAIYEVSAKIYQSQNNQQNPQGDGSDTFYNAGEGTIDADYDFTDEDKDGK